MKVPEHVAFSFLLAQLGVQQQYGWAGTALVIVAGLLPDLDGIGIIGGWRFYRAFHRVWGHSLPLTLLGPLALALLGAYLFQLGPLLPLWIWLQVSLVAHLATDVCFYRWPVQLAWPLSQRGWELGLLSWNDLVPTLLLYGGTLLVIAWPAATWWIALTSLSALAGYVAWRAYSPRAKHAWEAWIAGDWTQTSPRFCRWLTGDFVT
jgi:membrane-bound metal-dependent hydrolase YbcI (DUF457 family)